MVEKLRSGKWVNQLATAEEVNSKVNEIMGLVTKYHWEKRNIFPYNYPINLVEFLEGAEFYWNCTTSSKRVFLSEINGLIEIINKWVEQEEEPKVTILFVRTNKKGQTKEIPASWLEDYVDAGLAVLVKEN